MRACKTLFLVPLLFMAACSHAQLKFSVSYPPSALDKPFTGRVVVYVSKEEGPPRIGPDWFNPQPCYSAKFKGIQPGTAMVLSSSNTVGFPGKLSALEPGEYHIQAVVDRDLGGRAIGTSPGNLYSDIQTLTLDPSNGHTIKLTCDHVVPEPKFVDTKHVKEIKIESKLLGQFYGRPTFVKGAVVLPDEWFTDPTKKFPVLYEIPGFGGDSMMLSGRDVTRGTVRDGVPFIYVYLDPNVPTGHCVFADSANNGPWGNALVSDFIPAVERKYRGIGQSKARFVTGHSSGGWSSLWLQVAYPDVFGGVWSTSPDPVDFHAFQLIDIYKPGANMFTDAHGQPVPLARSGDQPIIFYKKFSDMERPIRGEQLGSFEAVFSPKGSDGEPVPLWNRDTGAIYRTTAAAWQKYDIARLLRQHWSTLGPKLKGKLHVYCGDMDTFYLDSAVRLLKTEMADLHSDAVVELVPGDHGSMMTQALRARMDHEMADQFRKHFR
jgi:S-formylglutathione hydrolase FrmB